MPRDERREGDKLSSEVDDRLNERLEAVRRGLETEKDFDAGRATFEDTPGGVMFLPKIGISEWPVVPDLKFSNKEMLETVRRLVRGG